MSQTYNYKFYFKEATKPVPSVASICDNDNIGNIGFILPISTNCNIKFAELR